MNAPFDPKSLGKVAVLMGGKSAERDSLDGLVERMERGEFDLIAVGRALLSDPEWVIKVRDGRDDELQDFDPASMKELA